MKARVAQIFLVDFWCLFVRKGNVLTMVNFTFFLVKGFDFFFRKREEVITGKISHSPTLSVPPPTYILGELSKRTVQVQKMLYFFPVQKRWDFFLFLAVILNSSSISGLYTSSRNPRVLKAANLSSLRIYWYLLWKLIRLISSSPREWTCKIWSERSNWFSYFQEIS